MGVRKEQKMKPSKQCFELIKKYEGYSGIAYLCPAKVPTIGWGSTMYDNGEPVKIGDVISKARAEDLLNYEVRHFADKINRLELGLNQNQFDSIVSLVYNIGIGAFRKSTILRLISQNPNSLDIAVQFGRWIYGGGKMLPGLVKRRADEMELYYKPI
jgi:lysozyme